MAAAAPSETFIMTLQKVTIPQIKGSKIKFEAGPLNMECKWDEDADDGGKEKPGNSSARIDSIRTSYQLLSAQN